MEARIDKDEWLHDDGVRSLFVSLSLRLHEANLPRKCRMLPPRRLAESAEAY